MKRILSIWRSAGAPSVGAAIVLLLLSATNAHAIEGCWDFWESYTWTLKIGTRTARQYVDNLHTVCFDAAAGTFISDAGWIGTTLQEGSSFRLNYNRIQVRRWMSANLSSIGVKRPRATVWYFRHWGIEDQAGNAVGTMRLKDGLVTGYFRGRFVKIRVSISGTFDAYSLSP